MNCPSCGEKMNSKSGTYHFDPPANVPGGLMIIPNSTWLQCPQCDEEMLTAELSKQLEDLAFARQQKEKLVCTIGGRKEPNMAGILLCPRLEERLDHAWSELQRKIGNRQRAKYGDISQIDLDTLCIEWLENRVEKVKETSNE